MVIRSGKFGDNFSTREGEHTQYTDPVLQNQRKHHRQQRFRLAFRNGFLQTSCAGPCRAGPQRLELYYVDRPNYRHDRPVFRVK